MEQNLNDDTLAEFNSDGSGISEPGETQAGIAQQVAVVDTTRTSGTDADDDVNLLELGEYDTWVKTTENDEEQLNRIEDVAKDILVAESISRADMERIFSDLDNTDFASQFTEGVSTLVGFTATLTKTNLDETKQFFRDDVAQRKAQLTERYKTFLEEKLVGVKTSLVGVTRVAERTISQLTTLSTLAQAASVKANASNNYLCYVAEKDSDDTKVHKVLKDIRSIPFNQWSNGVIAEMLVGIPASVITDYNTAFNTASPFLDSYSKFKSCFTKQQTSSDVHIRDLSVILKKEYSYQQTTYLTMLSLFASPTLIASVDALQFELNESLTLLDASSGCLGEKLITILHNLYIAGMFLNAAESLIEPATLTITAFNDVL